MKCCGTASFEKDRALVEAMLLVGERVSVIEDFLLCLDLSDDELDQLRRIAGSERVAERAMARRPPSADVTLRAVTHDRREPLMPRHVPA